MRDVVAIVCLSACSFANVRDVSSPPPGEQPRRCRGGLADPIVDTMGTVLVGGGGLLVWHSCEGYGCALLAFARLPWAVITVATTASAVYGYATVTPCTRTQREAERLVSPRARSVDARHARKDGRVQ